MLYLLMLMPMFWLLLLVSRPLLASLLLLASSRMLLHGVPADTGVLLLMIAGVAVLLVSFFAQIPTAV